MQSGDMVPPNAHPDVAIITLSPDRWREYRDLRLAALRTDPTAFGETVERARAHPDAHWRDRLTDPDNWLVFAESGGRLVGLAGAFVLPDEPAVILIVSVYVDPAHRGAGVGRRLMTSLIDSLLATPHEVILRLWVNETNAPAIALYESLGFVAVGIERDVLLLDGVSYDKSVMERPAVR